MPKNSLAEWVLYQDADYIIINKPPGMATLEDRSDPQNVLRLLRQLYPGVQVGHRLDKDTSGVLIAARRPEAYRHISMQFENRSVSKIYHAVAHGLHRFQQQEVTRAIQPQKDGTVKLSASGKPAQTWFSTLEVYKRHTLLQCRPVTGRMHQIRVHAAFLNAPLVCDALYGGKPVYLSEIKAAFKLKKDAEEAPLINRVALHAYAVEFQLLDGNTLKIVAPYPKDFRALLHQLQRQTG
jgi:23S rRNA pseudouridine955/2504/2580 synthase